MSHLPSHCSMYPEDKIQFEGSEMFRGLTSAMWRSASGQHNCIFEEYRSSAKASNSESFDIHIFSKEFREWIGICVIMESEKKLSGMGSTHPAKPTGGLYHPSRSELKLFVSPSRCQLSLKQVLTSRGKESLYGLRLLRISTFFQINSGDCSLARRSS